MMSYVKDDSGEEYNDEDVDKDNEEDDNKSSTFKFK